MYSSAEIISPFEKIKAALSLTPIKSMTFSNHITVHAFF
uniref:Uncharacterized protein n=1 Tax=Anguilla anguilla TaxID=7936 RepID=A0A0E9QJ83_ANGAN